MIRFITESKNTIDCISYLKVMKALSQFQMNEYMLLYKIENRNLDFKLYKIDGVASLIADPPPANSTTTHRRLIKEEKKLCLGGTAYFPGPAKLVQE